MNEIKFIKDFVHDFERYGKQINPVFGSDSELLDVADLLTQGYLAISTDSISEEIERGILDDPFQIGWMLIAANISDLSAVGAIPFGVLLNLTLPNDKSTDQPYLDQLKLGIKSAIEKCKTHLIGGDTNFANQANFVATVLGHTDKNHTLTRLGCLPNDLLYTSGKLGIGNCFAANKFFGLGINVDYMPEPRIEEAQIIKKFASSCIDTSDGFMHTLHQLMTTNKVGFALTEPTSTYVCETAFAIKQYTNTTELAFLAGILGEYELIFTIPAEKNEAFLNAASQHSFAPILIGNATAATECSFSQKGIIQNIDIESIVSLYEDDLAKYIEKIKVLFKNP